MIGLGRRDETAACCCIVDEELLAFELTPSDANENEFIMLLALDEAPYCKLSPLFSELYAEPLPMTPVVVDLS